MRMAGFGLLAWADTAALVLGMEFAAIASAALSPIAYYGGYLDGFMFGIEAEW